MKKLISVLLCVCMLFGADLALAASAADVTEVNARLYAFYGDNMVFEQNEKTTLAGVASPGASVECRLADKSGAVVATGKTVSSPDSTFEVGFDAPSGGFDEYEIVILENGREFARLKGILFGEVWLASGQSNMQYSLDCCSTWDKEVEKGFADKSIRFMYGPDFPDIYEKGVTDIPDSGAEDYYGCEWIRGDSRQVAKVSAVAYYFAEELFSRLNVPVGVLCVYLGGSPIRSWISRQTLESSDEAISILKEHKQYVPSKKWNPSKQTYSDLGSNYNVKIYPLRRFRISGLVWYQGETDLLTNYTYGQYGTMFDLLQEEYTKTFSHTSGGLPIVYTQLACYNYRTDDRDLQSMNAEYADIRASSPDTRAVTSISDVPLDFVLEWGSIHPSVKEPVGTRLGYAAAGLVYGKNDTFSAPYFKSVASDGKYMYVTLSDVGDGIVSDSEVLYDFAVCGADGVYYPAHAQIVSADTVRVYSDRISEPRSVTYAFSQVNNRATLFSSKNGQKIMPVSPFVTDRSISKFYYSAVPWTDCDTEKQFRTGSREQFVGWYDLWSADGCAYDVSRDSAYAGTGGLHVTSDSAEFSLKQTLVFDIDDESISKGKPIKFNEASRKWIHYGALRFAVRNNGAEDITFGGAKITLADKIWAYPEVNGSGRCETVIPADGEWHTVELNFNRLYLYGNTLSIPMTSIVLDEVRELEIKFDNRNGSAAELDVDEFEFTPASYEKSATRASLLVRLKDTVSRLVEYFSRLFSSACSAE